MVSFQYNCDFLMFYEYVKYFKPIFQELPAKIHKELIHQDEFRFKFEEC